MSFFVYAIFIGLGILYRPMDKPEVDAIPHVKLYRAIETGNYGDAARALSPGPEMVYDSYTAPYRVANDLYHERYLSAGLTYGGHVLTGLTMAVGLRTPKPPGQATTEAVKKVFTAEVEQTSAILAGEVEEVATNGVGALIRAGNVLDKGGFTAVGRALQKHASRIGSIFPKTTGNAAAINAQGEAVLNRILTSPNVTSVTRHHARFGNVLEYRIPGGQGARFSGDGKTFIGFLE